MSGLAALLTGIIEPLAFCSDFPGKDPTEPDLLNRRLRPFFVPRTPPYFLRFQRLRMFQNQTEANAGNPNHPPWG
jgi:hypothetical protein